MKAKQECLLWQLSLACHQQAVGSCAALSTVSTSSPGQAQQEHLKGLWRHDEINGAKTSGVNRKICYCSCTTAEL